jgi:hypothetical protein
MQIDKQLSFSGAPLDTVVSCGKYIVTALRKCHQVSNGDSPRLTATSVRSAPHSQWDPDPLAQWHNEMLSR